MESSDLDILAVVVYPIDFNCGLSRLEQTFKNPEGSQHDFTIHVCFNLRISYKTLYHANTCYILEFSDASCTLIDEFSQLNIIWH